MSQVNVDNLDLSIMSQLVDDGRKSYSDIAADLGVSAGTVRNRLARLEQNGTLKVIGFIDLDQIGVQIYATVYVRVSPSRLIGDVVEQLGQFPEVSFLASVAGEFDLHVDVQCLDKDHFQGFLNKCVHEIEGVTDTQTTMVLKIHKYGQPQLAALRDSAERIKS